MTLRCVNSPLTDTDIERVRACVHVQRRQYLDQMLQQHLTAQVDHHQQTSTSTSSPAASGKDAAARQSRSGRSLKTSGARSQQHQRSTLSSKLLHHQSKLEQALTGTSAAASSEQTAFSGGVDAAQDLAAGIESGGGAALMTNFAALATGSRQLTSAASLPTNSGEQRI